MSAESTLLEDLAGLDERFADDEFSTELYRALARNRWTKDDHTVSLSWSRAEELVNELRARRAQDPLELAQTGDEGEVSPLVLDEAGRLGWSIEALDTTTHDPEHSSKPVESPPPLGTGEAHAPVEDAGGWERKAHEDAERARREHVGRR